MRRLTLFAFAALLTVTSCASTFPALAPITMTVPAMDNAAASCAVPEVLVAVPDTAFRVVYLRVTQGAWAWQDSLVTYASKGAVTFTPPPPPTFAVCTAEAWARDRGGAGCHITASRTPTAVTLYPARPVFQP